MNKAEIEDAFAKIPQLRQWRPADFEITPLPGYTNRNFRLVNDRQDWVLRIPLARTSVFIDREAEAHNQALAAGLGIAPEPAWRDAGGMSLTPTLADARAVTAADLADARKLGPVIDAIRGLHRSGAKFRGRVAPGLLIERYFDLIPAAERERLRSRLEAARLLSASFEDRDYAYVPSHNDLVLQNLLRSPTRIWLIDWEFSAMASPCWDLATLCNAANLDYAQSRRLLLAYCAGSTPMEESLLFDYRNLLQLLTDCWMTALVKP